MSEKIKLITDSTCDLSEELVKELDLCVVPLLVSYEGSEVTYRDGIDITIKDIEKHVKETGKLPITSAIGPANWQETFDKYIDEGYSIIFTGIGSTLSANFQSAMIGKNTCKDPEKVTLIDSKNLSTATSILIFKIRDMINEGKTREEIKEICDRDIVPNIRGQFCIDTPDYLVKGGRCSAVAGLLVKLLRIKPVVKVVDGKLTVAQKPIGTIKNAVYIQYQDMLKQISNIDPNYCFITFVDSDEANEYIREIILKECNFKHVYSTNAGAVISSHCGPGTIGILYLMKPESERTAQAPKKDARPKKEAPKRENKPKKDNPQKEEKPKKEQIKKEAKPKKQNNK